MNSVFAMADSPPGRKFAARPHSRVRAGHRAALAMVCALALAACNNNESAAGSQVVAHVGKGVITTSELDTELRLANISAKESQNPAVLRQVLSEMVTRKYLEQQAIGAGLDREPQTLLELMRARSQVMAAAYVNRAVSANPMTQAEVAKYIDGNPLKFGQRTTLATDQITLPWAADSQALASANQNVGSLDELERRLAAAGIPHVRASGSLSSTDIAPDLYQRIQDKTAAAVSFTRVGANGVFFEIKSMAPAPLTGEAAQNAARQYLRADRVKAQMGLASMSADMEAQFVGNYARIMKSP
ncbi:MAG: hypothetical protein LBQ32_09040 [Burkholderiaceae bacterium]|nr:hypothetical protein [Burkholderiaceae bacterium]